MSSMNLEQIKGELLPLKKYDVVLFGSLVTGEWRKGSDIDIAIVTRIRDEKTNIRILKESLKKVSSKYDIRIFELLPIKVKASIIENYKVVFGDELEISEYFYYWRKFWNDISHRISYHRSYKDKLKALERGKKIKKI
ncbi:MAG TPA: DNA polymerase subunit beta [Archaeoglobaceae archaeon]|nr:DNA polymerase subunit beta [Archaeoglobaceae archaeon]